MKTTILLLLCIFNLGVISAQNEEALIDDAVNYNLSMQIKRNYLIKKYAEYSSSMGRSTTTVLKNKISISRQNEIFLDTKYIVDKIPYNGRNFYDVTVSVQIPFTHVDLVYEKNDDVVLVVNRKGFIRNVTLKDGFKDGARVTNNHSIRITDDDKRKATVKLLNFFVKNPYYN